MNARFVKALLAGTVMCCSLVTPSFAGSRLTAQSIMKFLNIGVGAKAGGMGDCYAASGGDVSIIFWNPAGLAGLKGKHAFIDQNSWIAEINKYSFAYSHDLGNWGVLGISTTYMDYGTIHGTTIDLVAATSGSFEYVETGQIDVGNYALGVAYARAISSQFSVGAQVKYVYSNLGSNMIVQAAESQTIENRLHAWAVDLGTWYRTGSKGITFSMALRNFSREVHYPRMQQRYYLPLVFSVGFSVDALRFFPSVDTKHTLIMGFDLLHPTDYLEKGNFGVEYGFNQQLFLRAGYKINYGFEDLSVGLGLRKPLSDRLALSFDYAYINTQIFNSSNRFSFAFNF